MGLEILIFIFVCNAGCGIETSDYQWASLDPKIVSVNAFGTVYAKGEGKTVVQAIALTNPMNSDKVIDLY